MIFSNGFQDHVLVTPVVDDTEHYDLFFLFINQIISNIVLHQNTPDVIPLQIRIMNGSACFWSLTDFLKLFFQLIGKSRGSIRIYQLIGDMVKGFIDI